MRIDHDDATPCFRVDATELYKMPSFQEWLIENASQGLATWHASSDLKMGEYSDIFILYDHGEGPESPCNQLGMPEECWDILDAACKEARITYALLWLINVIE